MMSACATTTRLNATHGGSLKHCIQHWESLRRTYSAIAVADRTSEQCRPAIARPLLLAQGAARVKARRRRLHRQRMPGHPHRHSRWRRLRTATGMCDEGLRPWPYGALRRAGWTQPQLSRALYRCSRCSSKRQQITLQGLNKHAGWLIGCPRLVWRGNLQGFGLVDCIFRSA